MFDFEKLVVYERIRSLNYEILRFLASPDFRDRYLQDQLRRATLSVALNVAEGSSRVSSGDKKRFYVIARSSVHECVAILHILLEQKKLQQPKYEAWYDSYEQISKMLLSLYRKV